MSSMSSVRKKYAAAGIREMISVLEADGWQKSCTENEGFWTFTRLHKDHHQINRKQKIRVCVMKIEDKICGYMHKEGYAMKKHCHSFVHNDNAGMYVCMYVCMCVCVYVYCIM